MVYPIISAGQRITSSLLTSMLPLETFKTASTTRTSTTVFADDPDLTLQLEANATYFVEIHVVFGALAAEDIKTNWTTPSGSVGNRTANGPGSTALEGNADNVSGKYGLHGYGTTITYNGVRDSASNQAWFIETSKIVTTNAGTCALQWAQGTSGVTGTTVGVGSYMRAKRMA
jgi:hypothetical protein